MLFSGLSSWFGWLLRLYQWFVRKNTEGNEDSVIDYLFLYCGFVKRWKKEEKKACEMQLVESKSVKLKQICEMIYIFVINLVE